MKKRFALLLTLLLLTCTMTFSTGAYYQTAEKIDFIHDEYGTIEVERFLTVYDSPARSNTKKADVTEVYKYGGKVVAEVTLSATFGYDGKTAWVTSASGSHTTYSGWSYSGEKITKSGGTATLNATLSHIVHSSIAVNIPLTCSPTGQIS